MKLTISGCRPGPAARAWLRNLPAGRKDASLPVPEVLCHGGQQQGDGTEQKTTIKPTQRDERGLLRFYHCKAPTLDFTFL